MHCMFIHSCKKIRITVLTIENKTNNTTPADYNNRVNTNTSDHNKIQVIVVVRATNNTNNNNNIINNHHNSAKVEGTS